MGVVRNECRFARQLWAGGARLILSKADIARLHAAASARALLVLRRHRIGRVAGVDVRLVDGLLVGGPSAPDQLVDSLRLVALSLSLLRAVDWWHGLPQPQLAEVSTGARVARVRTAATRTLPFLFGGDGTRPKRGGFETLYALSCARGDAIADQVANDLATDREGGHFQRTAPEAYRHATCTCDMCMCMCMSCDKPRVAREINLYYDLVKE